MAAALTLCMAAAGCVHPGVQTPGPVVAAPLRVMNGGHPFALWEGAAARRVAEGECAAKGLRLRTSIYDRFEGGAWVYPEGCA